MSEAESGRSSSAAAAARQPLSHDPGQGAGVPARRRVLTRSSVFGWAMYDWANSSFSTTVMAGFFPLFFKQYWSAGSVATESTFRLGLANGVASFIVALLAPLIGAIADKGGARVKLLGLFTVLGTTATTALYLVGKGDWVTAAVLYVTASLGFWGGNQFYDSLLTDVSDVPEYDLVSGYGFALGYLGGGLLFALNVLMVTKPGSFGLANAGEGVRWSFVSVGAWWMLFTLFTLTLVRERRTNQPLPALAAIGAGLRELGGTLRHLRHDRVLLWFLLAYWFYIDGVNTIIKMSVDYGLSLGLKQNSLITALLVVQFVGFPAALAFGWLGQKLGPRTGILLGIAVYAGIAGYAYFLHTEAQFMTMAIVIGLVQGGVQSLSRSLFGRLVPPGKAGEFFGFYNLMGKAAAILGPTLTGVVALLSHDSRLAILSITVLFVLGAAFLLKVPLETRA
ncbi:MAG TPA: MFS transporter [Steroidobacteraceae bacterium]|nr:MFS transporter [Steroidobacteraceae bacterium]